MKQVLSLNKPCLALGEEHLLQHFNYCTFICSRQVFVLWKIPHSSFRCFLTVGCRLFIASMSTLSLHYLNILLILPFDYFIINFCFNRLLLVLVFCFKGSLKGLFYCSSSAYLLLTNLTAWPVQCSVFSVSLR